MRRLLLILGLALVAVASAFSAIAGAATTNCMPTPSACGYPDTTNTGTLPGVARTAVSGTVTLSTAGQVYENRTVTGGIVVTAPNVTIRNVKVIKTGYWAIDTRASKGNSGGLQIQDAEIDLNGDFDGYGIVCDNYIATRVFIHNGADGGYLCTNATVRDSLITLGPDTNNDGLPDGTTFCNQNAPGSNPPSPPHFDALSSDGGSNQVYDHNTLRNPCSQTSAILISTNSGTIRNVKITNNLLAGGGWTLYCDAGPDVQGGETVTGNRIARTYRPQGGYYGPAANCGGSSMTYSGNVWDDTGQLLPGQGASPPPPPPPPPPADRDGDGVPDLQDACPDVAAPGTLDGCPAPPPPPPPAGCDQACVDALKADLATRTSERDQARTDLAAMTASRDSVQAIADAYKARAEKAEAIVVKVRQDVAP